MKLYFVRHGESKYNALNIHQRADTELSAKGFQQAKFVANRFRDIKIELIIASDYLRAQQTAEEIGRAVQKKTVFTPLLREIKNPSAIEGKHFDDPDAIQVKEILRNNVKLTDWHFSDEENFHDAKHRAAKFLDYVNLLTEENILAVTHGKILCMIISLIIFGRGLSFDEFSRLKAVLDLSNTGITLCEKNQDGEWKLITWNDHAHLG